MADLFDRTEREVWGGFIVTQARLFRVIEEDLKRGFGISHAEFEALLRLWKAPDGRLRLQDLAASSLLSPSGTSRAVDRLARAGLVTREGAPEDARGAYAVLTVAGRARFDEAARAHVALVRREFLDRLTADEKATLAGIWKKMGDGRGQSG